MTDHELAPIETNSHDILRLLDLERVDDDLFRNRVNDININGALYGGQVLAQALRAASHTVEGRPVHSLHGYFVRRGDGTRPVIYQVERIRDGGSFTTRRVTAIQRGVPIFLMETSFHTGDPGFDHVVAPQLPWPDPDELESLAELADSMTEGLTDRMRERMRGYRVLEIKPTDPERHLTRASDKAINSFWTRVPSAAGSDDPVVHACAMAYASDSWLAAATRMVHASPMNIDRLQLASLDHAMWFHAPIRADAWNLYETDSPWTGSGRGLARGQIFNRQGVPVASTAQEVLLRPVRGS